MKSNIILLGAIVILLAGCSITENRNKTLTVVNSTPQMGKVYVNGELIPEVYSRSWFSRASVQLKAELNAVNRAYFAGWLFSNHDAGLDGDYVGQSVVKDNPVTIPIDEYHRVAVARFSPEKHDGACFLSDELILFRSTNAGGVTWNATRHANGMRTGNPSLVFASSDSYPPYAKSFPNNAWVLFSGNVLWNAKTGARCTIYPRNLSSTNIVGVDNGNLLLLQSGENDSSVRLSILNADGGVLASQDLSETPLSYDTRDLFDERYDGTRYFILTAERNFELRKSETVWILPRSITKVRLADVKNGTIASFAPPIPSDSSPITYIMGDLASDGSGRSIFVGNGVFTGKIASVVVYNPDGSKYVELNSSQCSATGLSKGDIYSVQWNADWTGLAWRDPATESWLSLAFGASEPVSIPGEPHHAGGTTTDTTVSPNGAWKLCAIESAIGDAIDVGIIPSGGSVADAVNLTVPEAAK